MANLFVVSVDINEFLASGEIKLRLKHTAEIHNYAFFLRSHPSAVVSAVVVTPEYTDILAPLELHEADDQLLFIPVSHRGPGVHLFGFKNTEEFFDELRRMMIQSLLGTTVNLKLMTSFLTGNEVWLNNAPYQHFNGPSNQPITLALDLGFVGDVSARLVDKLFAWFVNMTERQIKDSRNVLLAGIFGRKR
ncbi:TPA: hypothetical protein DF272_02520 [Candidatus Falkowbacteria bacterium]|nr:hypothetical protein [Candidatus Falkowbacteria bacterium]